LVEYIEVRNETDKSVIASACRSKLSGRLFVHIGFSHNKSVKIAPNDYAIVEVREVTL